jgi:hypothetical protein
MSQSTRQPADIQLRNSSGFSAPPPPPEGYAIEKQLPNGFFFRDKQGLGRIAGQKQRAITKR